MQGVGRPADSRISRGLAAGSAIRYSNCAGNPSGATLATVRRTDKDSNTAFGPVPANSSFHGSFPFLSLRSTRIYCCYATPEVREAVSRWTPETYGDRTSLPRNHAPQTHRAARWCSSVHACGVRRQDGDVCWPIFENRQANLALAVSQHPKSAGKSPPLCGFNLAAILGPLGCATALESSAMRRYS